MNQAKDKISPFTNLINKSRFEQTGSPAPNISENPAGVKYAGQGTK
jgi:hypothetical protein